MAKCTPNKIGKNVSFTAKKVNANIQYTPKKVNKELCFEPGDEIIEATTFDYSFDFLLS